MGNESLRLKQVVEDTFSTYKSLLDGYKPEVEAEEIGIVKSVGRGIARIDGLFNVQAEELVRFSGGLMGMAFNLDPDELGVILLGSGVGVSSGERVYRTHRVMDVPVGEGMLGRVI
ncbi:MAG: F0F1 ATP synthase subunit alpha, partial [Anaerolineales bacterium]|nr:F0F1 ATP synthase subunit alpha [Anaerolineales bacterium]